MSREKTSEVLKLALIGSGIAVGALIPLIPAIKRRAMRVTAILAKDHRMMSGLIRTLEVAPRINATFRERLFDRLRANVMVHAQVEEEILYPVMRRNVMSMGDESKVDESYRQHQQIRDLLTDLDTMDPNTDAFDRKFGDFKAKFQQHLVQEEGEIFMIVRQRMSSEEQERLGKRIHERKISLMPKRAA
jgi:hemerythrin-like domain-containing protein